MHLRWLPLPLSLLFSLGGGVLMRLCVPRVSGSWHWGGGTQLVMGGRMKLGGGTLALPAWLQRGTPCPPAELTFLPSPGLSEVLLLLSVREQEQGHSVGNVISELPIWEN